jgi:hypothetical protein
MDNISVILAHANSVINTANSYIAYGTSIIGALALVVAAFSVYVTLYMKKSKQEIVNQTIKEILIFIYPLFCPFATQFLASPLTHLL